MSFSFAEITMLLRSTRVLYPGRPPMGNVLPAATDLRPASATLVALMLRDSGEREQKTECEQSNQLFHVIVTFLKS